MCGFLGGKIVCVEVLPTRFGSSRLRGFCSISRVAFAWIRHRIDLSTMERSMKLSADDGL